MKSNLCRLTRTVILIIMSYLTHDSDATEILSCRVTAYAGAKSPVTVNVTYDGGFHNQTRIVASSSDLNQYQDFQRPCETAITTTNLPQITSCLFPGYMIVRLSYAPGTTVTNTNITFYYFNFPPQGRSFGDDVIRVRAYGDSSGSFCYCDAFTLLSGTPPSSFLYGNYIYIYI